MSEKAKAIIESSGCLRAMTWSMLGRRKELLAGTLLLVMTISNVVALRDLVPFLRNGYQNFTIFYTAGKLVRDGRTAALFDLTAQYQVQQEIAPHVRIRQAALPYNHPPFEALLFEPFAGLPYWPAYLLWTALNIVMTAAALWILHKHFADLHRGSAAFLCLAAAGFYPWFSAIVQGQDCILLLLACTVALVAFDKEEDALAGAALAMGLFRFQLVLPMILILAVRRRRLLLGFVPVAVLWIAISMAMVGWRGVIQYPSFLMALEKNGAGGSIVVREMPNLRGIVAGLPAIQNSSSSMIALPLLCSLVVVGLAIWRIQKGRDSAGVAFIVATAAAILVGYHTLAYDLTLLLPALLLLFFQQERGSRNESNLDVVLLASLFLTSRFQLLGPSLTALAWFALLLTWLYRKRNTTVERRLAASP